MSIVFPPPDSRSTTTVHADALERLAAALDSGRYATVMVSGQRVPSLRVVSRNAPELTEDIYAGSGYFCGPSSEPIAPVTDVPAAAEKIAHVLGGEPPRTRAGQIREHGC
jgi:hypothetical protein